MWQVIGNIADIIALITALITVFVAYKTWKNTQKLKTDIEKENKRMDVPIKIILYYGADSIELPIGIKRKDATRAEIMGRIGTIPMKKKQDRYKIEYFGTGSFITEIEEIYKDNSERDLKIPCNKEEFEQFDLDAYRKKMK